MIHLPPVAPRTKPLGSSQATFVMLYSGSVIENVHARCGNDSGSLPMPNFIALEISKVARHSLQKPMADSHTKATIPVEGS